MPKIKRERSPSPDQRSNRSRPSTEPTSDYTAVTEVQNHFVLTADGILQVYLEEILQSRCSELVKEAGQGYVNFGTVCSVGQMLDHLLLAVKRPSRWGISNDKFGKPLPDGKVPITDDLAEHLSTKCSLALRLAGRRHLTIEFLDGFAAVLKIITEAILESNSSSIALKPIPLPDMANVSLLPKDKREALSSAVSSAEKLISKDKMTNDSLFNLCKAIDGVLQSAGRPAEQIVSRPSVQNRHKPFGRYKVIWLAQPLEEVSDSIRAGDLKIGALSGLLRTLNAILMSEI